LPPESPPHGAKSTEAFQRVSPIRGDAITINVMAFDAPPDVWRHRIARSFNPDQRG
jgi:hypothetical protein